MESPENLLQNCEVWCERCKLCASATKRPSVEPAYTSLKSCVPFFHMQIDLMEVNPPGVDGDRWVLTCICVATRYMFLQCAKTRDAHYLATLLLDVGWIWELRLSWSSLITSSLTWHSRSYAPCWVPGSCSAQPYIHNFKASWKQLTEPFALDWSYYLRHL